MIKRLTGCISLHGKAGEISCLRHNSLYQPLGCSSAFGGHVTVSQVKSSLRVYLRQFKVLAIGYHVVFIGCVGDVGCTFVVPRQRCARFLFLVLCLQGQHQVSQLF